MIRRSAFAFVVAVGLAVAILVAPASREPVQGASYPDDLVWLALGDSYSSGEGLPNNDRQANPSGKDCQRGTGRTGEGGGESRAYGVVAYDTVRGDMINSDFRLLACTGDITNDVGERYRNEWLERGGKNADLVTISIGGNNIGFAATIQRCIGFRPDNSTGAGIILNPAIGCDTDIDEQRSNIDQMIGTGTPDEQAPDGGQTLHDMYVEMANTLMNPGGNVVVTGYPNLVEESARWRLGWLEGNRCSRVRRSDTAMLRSAAGYLNEQIALLTQRLNDSEKTNDVTFTFVDTAQVYENDKTGRHGLCTREPWINGVTIDPDRGFEAFNRSFHPTQSGHDTLGADVAATVAGLEWADLRRPAPNPLADVDRSTPASAASAFMAAVLDGDDDVAAALEAPDATWSNLDFYRDRTATIPDYQRDAACGDGDTVTSCWWEQDDGGSSLRMRLTDDGWAVWYPYLALPWWYGYERDIELCVVGDDPAPARSGDTPSFPVIAQLEPGTCGLRSYSPPFGGLWVVQLGDTDDDVVYVNEANLEPDESAGSATSPAEALARVEVPSLCQHPAGTAVDGTIPSNDPNGTNGFWDMLLDEAVAAQLDGDPPLEYAVEVTCSAGGVSWPSYLLLYDDDVSLFAHFSVSDLYPNDSVWRGGFSSLAGDPILSGQLGFEESGAGPWYDSYFSLDSFASYPCVTVGDLDTGDPYPINVDSGEVCGPDGLEVVGPAPEFVDDEPEGDPVGVLTGYFLAAGARDYREAWSMLSAGYQDAYGSYDRFVDFWDGIDTVGIDSTTFTDSGATSTVTADVWFRRLDGSVSAETIEVDVNGYKIADYRFIRIR